MCYPNFLCHKYFIQISYTPKVCYPNFLCQKYIIQMSHMSKVYYPNSLNVKIKGSYVIQISKSHTLWFTGRELYVKELQKYIPVDVYGLCGPLRCGKNHNDAYCYEQVLTPSYKFYLAFENTLCQDYITEKVRLYHDLLWKFGDLEFPCFDVFMAISCNDSLFHHVIWWWPWNKRIAFYVVLCN